MYFATGPSAVRVPLTRVGNAVENVPALGDFGAYLNQPDRRSVPVLTGLTAGLAGEIACPGAFDHGAELEARQREVPTQMDGLATARRQVGVEQFPPRRQSAERRQRLTAGERVVTARPAHEHPPQVHQWVADGAHLPVDERGHLGPVAGQQHVVEVRIPVHDSRCRVWWTILL